MNFPWFEKKVDDPNKVPEATIKTVEFMTEQCCALFDLPLQEPVEVIIINKDNLTPKAIFNCMHDRIEISGFDNLKDNILAHEIAHAVLYHSYPEITVKIAEYLAGYAEYKICKVLGN